MRPRSLRLARWSAAALAMFAMASPAVIDARDLTRPHYVPSDSPEGRLYARLQSIISTPLEANAKSDPLSGKPPVWVVPPLALQRASAWLQYGARQYAAAQRTMETNPNPNSSVVINGTTWGVQALLDTYAGAVRDAVREIKDITSPILALPNDKVDPEVKDSAKFLSDKADDLLKKVNTVAPVPVTPTTFQQMVDKLERDMQRIQFQSSLQLRSLRDDLELTQKVLIQKHYEVVDLQERVKKLEEGGTGTPVIYMVPQERKCFPLFRR